MENEKWYSSLVRYTRPYRNSYVTSALLAVIGGLLTIVPYYSVSKVVILIFQGEGSFGPYVEWVLLALAAVTLKAVFNALSTTVSHVITFRLLSEIRKKMVRKMSTAPLGEIEGQRSGEIKKILTEKTGSLEPSMAHMIPELTAHMVAPIAIIVFIATLDWRLGIASLATIPITVFILRKMMTDYGAKFKIYEDAGAEMNAVAVEYVNGIEVIKMFNQSSESYAKFTDAAEKRARSALDWMDTVQIWFALAMGILPSVLVFVLPVGCWLFMSGSLGPESFITCVILSMAIIPHFTKAMSAVDIIAQIGVTFQSIEGILGMPDLERPDGRAVVTSHTVRLDGVSFSYDGHGNALDGVTMEMAEGEVTALVGPSGSGKTTVAKLVTSFWDAASGTVSVGGVDVRDMPLEQNMDLVSYVSQNTYLFRGTVMDNIRMGRPEATDDEVIAASKECGCHDFIESLDRGYMTQVGEGGLTLSGGERQRITIARAMLKDAPVIILDEATAYVDPENEAVVQKAVSRLVRDKTVIVIAHRLSTVMNSDKIVVMDGGRVEGIGKHGELLASSPLYKGMWDAHVSAMDSAGGA